MSRQFSAVVLFLLLAGCQHRPTTPSIGAELRDELLQMEVDDQAPRNQHASTQDAIRELNGVIEALNIKHALRLKEIVKVHGWRTRSLVGAEGAKAAWLIVQHSDFDQKFQREVLDLMAPLVGTGDVSGSEYAYLWDRTHSPQRYGTQGDCTKDGKWVVRDIESPSEVNARREAAGLYPVRLEDYIQMGASICTTHG